MRIKHITPLALAGIARSQSLTDILAAQNATLSTLNGFLGEQQALLDKVSGTEDITVLAPNNAALSGLSADTIDRVSSDPAFLTALLSYHILNGTYYASNFTSSSSLSSYSSPSISSSLSLLSPIRTLLNSTAYANVTGGQRVLSSVDANGDISLLSSGRTGAAAVVQGTDFNFTGGTIHIIDAMLSMPSNLSTTLRSANLDLTAAAGALKQSGMAEAMDAAAEVTVFVPTNKAFNAIGSLIADMTVEDLRRVLQYHVVVNGGGGSASDSQRDGGGGGGGGGVLYSSVMMGMVDAVGGGDGISKVATSGGQGDMHFRVEDGELFVNSARVVQADVLIANGVVHVIDGYVVFRFLSLSLSLPSLSLSLSLFSRKKKKRKQLTTKSQNLTKKNRVLNPKNPSATPNPAAATPEPAFSGASSTGAIPFTTGIVPLPVTTAAATATTPTKPGPGSATTTAGSSDPVTGAGSGAASVGRMAAGGAVVCYAVGGWLLRDVSTYLA